MRLEAEQERDALKDTIESMVGISFVHCHGPPSTPIFTVSVGSRDLVNCEMMVVQGVTSARWLRLRNVASNTPKSLNRILGVP